MKKARFKLLALAVMTVLGTSCSPAALPSSAPSSHIDQASTKISATVGPAESTSTATPYPVTTRATVGPSQTDFPSGFNTLTGLMAADPSLLTIPAVLVSVSHFPPSARPQSGLSFAPYVFEFSITTGETRFLAVFYGEAPAPQVPMTGNCGVRGEPFIQTDLLLGNRGWFDANQNGFQDPGEEVVAGVCVNLYDVNGKVLQQTTTDSNGYYGFNVQTSQTYKVGFVKPSGLNFTKENVGQPNLDSNADPNTGMTADMTLSQDDLSWDAGLVADPASSAPTPDPSSTPEAALGPVRSGRLFYKYVAGSFTDSCLIDAFASPEVLSQIPHCAFVTHEVEGGGSMISLDRFNKIALENEKNAIPAFEYASNLFTQQPPAGGLPAKQLNVFYAFLNQSGWTYDPLYQAYLRYVDTADKNSAGVLHPEIDRLTGRQLHFENVIIVMADTDVVSPTNLNIHLDEGNDGYAYLFRDGQMYKIRWSTRAGAYEKQTALRHPMQFVNMDGSPAALKPGHTWVIIVTPFSYFAEQTPGSYLVRYAAPQGEMR